MLVSGAIQLASSAAGSAPVLAGYRGFMSLPQGNRDCRIDRRLLLGAARRSAAWCLQISHRRRLPAASAYLHCSSSSCCSSFCWRELDGFELASTMVLLAMGTLRRHGPAPGCCWASGGVILVSVVVSIVNGRLLRGLHGCLQKPVEIQLRKEAVDYWEVVFAIQIPRFVVAQKVKAGRISKPTRKPFKLRLSSWTWA